MAIELYVEPGIVYAWDDFVNSKPPYSIALDGIVRASTKRLRLPKGLYANYDHHADVDRLSTRSTSEQAYMEINLGLFDYFKENGERTANVFVNDADEDTSLAWWLLKNNERVEHHATPQINKLVRCEDLLDTTGGAYSFGEQTKIRMQMAWVFEPYHDARYSGELYGMSSESMRQVIEDVESRIGIFVEGLSKEIALEGQYDVIGGGKRWVFVKETGPAARMALFNDGIRAFVSLVAEKDDGSRVYSVGKKSPWVPISLPAVYDAMNAEEKNDDHKWNGSDLSGGSPKGAGSIIAPERLEEIMNNLERE
jgi:hypothetical protein